jgi:hypothetical protein
MRRIETMNATNATAVETIAAGVIVTRYLSPTNHRGSRIKATSASGRSATLAWNHELSVRENHAAVAGLLATKVLELDPTQFTLVGGVLANEDFAFAVLRK